MVGFFTEKQVGGGGGKLYTCMTCGKHKRVITPRFKPWGKGRKGILLLAEVPVYADDTAGEPWKSKGGQDLVILLDSLGIDMYEDCVTVYAVHCRTIDEYTGNDRDVNLLDVDMCRKVTWKYLQEIQPKIIISLGIHSIECVIGHHWKKNIGDIDKWRGWVIPDQDLKAWVAPVYHQDYASAVKTEKPVIWRVFENDIKNALMYIHKPWERCKKFDIEIIDDLRPLRDIQEGAVAIDYETTGLKPHAPGHRVVCASVADTPNHCYAFMMPAKKRERQPFIDILANPGVEKMAHNMKFEEAWSVTRLRQPVENWAWDSMVAAHILDNRPGITGLKFQTYVNFGVVDYDSEINPYLKSISKGGNEINRIFELVERFGGKEQLLRYCGMDTIYQYRLALKQMDIMDYDGLPF